MFKVGIIGTGRIFDLNILGYLENKDAEITALCNRTIQKAKEKANTHQINGELNFYSDYKEMLSNEELDIVEILLPNNLHAEATIHTSNAGVQAISVQKPIASTLKEAEEIIKVCKSNDTLLSIYENFLFAPHILKAKSLLDKDYIGEITSLRIKTILAGKGGWSVPSSSEEWRQDPKQLGGSQHRAHPILFDNGWHAFALASWFVDEDIHKVFAWTDSHNGYDSPALVMFQYTRNNKHLIPQYGNMEFTVLPEMKIPSNYYPTDEFIEIIGTRGIMKINQITSIGNLMSESKLFPPLLIIRDGKVEIYDDFVKDWNQSFINATHHFLEAVKGKVKPILSPHDAYKVMKFNVAALTSTNQNKEIVLN